MYIFQMFKDWNVAELIRAQRLELLKQFRETCQEDALPYINNIDQGSVCSVFITSIPNWSQFKLKSHKAAYIYVKNNVDLDDLYYIHPESKTTIKLKASPEALELFKTQEIPTQKDIEISLTLEQLSAIEKQTGHTHSNGVPYKNFEREPEQIVQFKTLMNGLYRLEQTFLELETLDSSALNTISSVASLLSNDILVRTGLQNESITTKAYNASQLLTQVFSDLYRYYEPELVDAATLVFNVQDKLKKRCGLLRLANDPAKPDLVFDEIKEQLKETDCVILYNEQLYYVGFTAGKIEQIKTNSVLQTKYDALQALCHDAYRITTESDELQLITDLVPTESFANSKEKDIGFFIGNLFSHMQSQPEGGVKTSFAKRLALYLPQHVEMLGKRIEQLTNVLNTHKTQLDEKTEKKLRQKLEKLTQEIKEASRKDIGIIGLVRLYGKTKDAYTEIFKKIKFVSEDLNVVVRGLLADLKYVVLPSVLATADKTELRFLMRPGTLSEPLMDEIKPIYEEIAGYSKSFIDFSQTQPATAGEAVIHTEKLLKLEDRGFNALRLSPVKKKVDALHGNILLLENALFHLQQIKPLLQLDSVYFEDSSAEAIVNHFRYFSAYWNDFIKTSNTPKIKKFKFKNNVLQINSNPKELGGYVAEFEAYLSRMLQNDRYNLKLHQALIESVDSRARTVVFPDHAIENPLDVELTRAELETGIANDNSSKSNFELYKWFKRKQADLLQADAACDELINHYNSKKKANSKAFFPNYSLELKKPNQRLAPNKLYVEIKQGVLNFETLEPAVLSEKTKIYLMPLKEAVKAGYRGCYVRDRESHDLSYISETGQVHKHIALNRSLLSVVIVTRLRKHKKAWQAHHNTLRGSVDQEKYQEPVYLEFSPEQIKSLITDESGHYPGTIKRASIPCAELNCSLKTLKSVNQLSAYRSRLYDEAMERGLIPQDERSSLAKQYDIIQPYLLNSSVNREEAQALDELLSHQLSGHFLPEKLRNTKKFVKQDLVDKLERLKREISLKRAGVDEKCVEFQGHFTSVSPDWDAIIPKSTEVTENGHVDAAIKSNLADFAGQEIEEFRPKDKHGNKTNFFWRALGDKRAPNKSVSEDRSNYWIKTTVLSTQLDDLKLSIVEALKKFNQPITQSLLSQSIEVRRMTANEYTGELEWGSRILTIEQYLSERNPSILLFPEIEKPQGLEQQPRQILFFKRLLNLHYYLEKIVEELEAMNQDESQAFYVGHLVKAYVYFSQNISPLIHDLLSDPYYARQCQDILKKTKAIYDEVSEKASLYSHVKTCCSIKMTEIPKRDLSNVNLEKYDSAYIRVINPAKKLDELYYVDKESKTCVSLVSSRKHKNHKVLIKRFDKVVPCVDGIFTQLEEKHLDKITAFLGHTHKREFGKIVRWPVVEKVLNVVQIFPVRESVTSKEEVQVFKKCSNQLSLRIENLFSDINASWPLLRVAVKLPWYIPLSRKLAHILSEFGSKTHEQLIANLGELKDKYFLELLEEADALEYKLGLQPGVLSSPLQAALDEFYFGLISPLVQNPDERVNFICGRDLGHLQSPFTNRIAKINAFEVKAKDDLAAAEQREATLKSLQTSIDSNLSYLNFSAKEQKIKQFITTYNRNLPDIKSALQGADIHFCSLQAAKDKDFRNVFVWDQSYSRLYYLDKNGDSAKQLHQGKECDYLVLKKPEVFSAFLRKTIHQPKALCCAFLMPDSLKSIRDVSKIPVANIPMGTYTSAYIRSGDMLIYVNKANPAKIICEQVPITKQKLDSLDYFGKELTPLRSEKDRTRPLYFSTVDDALKQKKKHCYVWHNNELFYIHGKALYQKIALANKDDFANALNTEYPEPRLENLILSEAFIEENITSKTLVQSYEIVARRKGSIIQPRTIYIDDLGDRGIRYTVKSSEQASEHSGIIDLKDLKKLGVTVPWSENNLIESLQEKISQILGITNKRGHTFEIPMVSKELDRIRLLAGHNPPELIKNDLATIHLSKKDIESQISANSSFEWESSYDYFSEDVESELIALLNEGALGAYDKTVDYYAKMRKINKIMPDLLAYCTGLKATANHAQQAAIDQIAYIQAQQRQASVSNNHLKRTVYQEYFNEKINQLCRDDSSNEIYQQKLKEHYLGCERELFGDTTDVTKDYTSYGRIIDDALTQANEKFIKLKEFKMALDSFQLYLDHAREQHYRASWLFESKETIDTKQKIIDELYTLVTDIKKTPKAQFDAVSDYLTNNNNQNIMALQRYHHHDLVSFANVLQLLCRLLRVITLGWYMPLTEQHTVTIKNQTEKMRKVGFFTDTGEVAREDDDLTATASDTTSEILQG